MPRILWTLPIDIAPDEPDVWITYRIEPGQRAITNADPYYCQEGYSPEIEIVEISGVQRAITGNEMQCFLDDSDAMECLDEAIIDLECSMREKAMEREWA